MSFKKVEIYDLDGTLLDSRISKFEYDNGDTILVNQEPMIIDSAQIDGAETVYYYVINNEL